MKTIKLADAIASVDENLLYDVLSERYERNTRPVRHFSRGFAAKIVAASAVIVLCTAFAFVLPHSAQTPPADFSNEISAENESSGGNESGRLPEYTDSTDVSTSEIKIDTPPDNYVYLYASYSEINRALSLPTSDEYIDLHNDEADYGPLYSNMLKRFDSGEEALYVPKINGNTIALRDSVGFPGVSLMTSELYNLPWIWYHCVIDGVELSVSISYTGVLESNEIETAQTYREILRLIAPNAPSPSNYQNHESYKEIYEKKLTLANGQAATAMISELKDTSKIYVMLYLNGALVSIKGDKDLFSDTFWESFELVEYDKN